VGESSENSPAIYGWVADKKASQSRQGRQKLFRPLRDFRVEIPLPSAKALGYFQQNSLSSLTHCYEAFFGKRKKNTIAF
jgi:hypothetical protein